MKLPRLREWRERRGLSQAELAEAAGTSQDGVSKWERGRRGAHPSTARRLAEALNLEVEDLQEVTERPKSAPTPPSLEWAMAASDAEYEAWLKTAKSTVLHKLWNRLTRVAEGMETWSEPWLTCVGRKEKAADQFLKNEGISGWKVHEPRGEVTHEKQEGREAG